MRRLFMMLFVLISFVSVSFVHAQVFAGNIDGEPIIGQSLLYLNGPLKPPVYIAVTAHAIYTLEPIAGGLAFGWKKLYDIQSGLSAVGAQPTMPKSDVIAVTTLQGTDYLFYYDAVEAIYEARKVNSPINGPTSNRREIYGRAWLWSSGPGDRNIQKTGAVINDDLYLLSSPHVWASSDTGMTWQMDSLGLSGAAVNDIAMDSSQRVYAATMTGLFFQDPGSNLWKMDSAFTLNSSLASVYIDRENRIFLTGVGGGVYLSTDNGVSWSVDTTGLGSHTPSSFGDDAFGNIYATVLGGVIYKSAGGTGAWSRIDAGITTITENTPSINAIGGDSIVVAATNFGAYVTTDQGKTWNEANSGLHAETYYGFVKNSPNRFFVSTNLGIFYIDPGDTVGHKSFPTSGYQGGLPIYEDSVQTLFTVTPNPDPNSVALGPIYKSTDSGLTWNPDTMGLSATVGRTFFVDEHGGEHIGSSYFGTNYYARVYAQDSLGNWILDTNGIPNKNFSYTSSFSTDRSGFLFASGYYQGAAKRVLHRPLAGGMWVVDTVGLPLSVSTFSTMKPGAPGEVFGTNGTVLYRHVGGVWGQISVPTPTLSKFTVDRNGTIFIVNTALAGFFYDDVGISMSTDHGVTWTMVTHDTVQVQILHSHGDTSYALLQGGGLYTLTKNGVVTSIPNQGTSKLPSAYRLSQNYPNPFNPTTTIRFDLPTPAVVTLIVYDIVGREIARLIDHKLMGPGNRYVEFNASTLASGVYLYRVTAEEVDHQATRTQKFTAVMKMILVK